MLSGKLRISCTKGSLLGSSGTCGVFLKGTQLSHTCHTVYNKWYSKWESILILCYKITKEGISQVIVFFININMCLFYHWIKDVSLLLWPSIYCINEVEPLFFIVFDSMNDSCENQWNLSVELYCSWRI